MTHPVRTSQPLPWPIVQALGRDSSSRLEDALERLDQISSAGPDVTRWAVLIPLKGDRDELAEWLADATRDERREWLFAHGHLPDGQGRMLASDLISTAPTARRLVQLQLFDLHPRMSAWAATALWRAHELAHGVWDALVAWRVISAAALSRALLEGSMAFIAEAGDIADAWAEMKAKGAPSFLEASELKNRLGDALLQAQFGSQIGEPPLRRPRVKKLMTRGVRRAGIDLDSIKTDYNWLCDAVHPSYGFQTAYAIELAKHHTGTQAIGTVGRGMSAVPAPGATDPTVARASATAAAISVEEFTRAWPRFVSVVDDFGLTSEVCFTSRLDYWRRHERPERNDPCPCGSGKKYKNCIHTWRGPPPTPMR